MLTLILSAQSTYPLVSYRTGSFKEKATPSEIEKQRNARRKAEEKYKAKCIEFAIDISQMQAKINSLSMQHGTLDDQTITKLKASTDQAYSNGTLVFESVQNAQDWGAFELGIMNAAAAKPQQPKYEDADAEKKQDPKYDYCEYTSHRANGRVQDWRRPFARSHNSSNKGISPFSSLKRLANYLSGKKTPK